MDINALRTQLQFTCDDLKNLTSSDLSEGKWQSKKMIYGALISSCPLVRDSAEKLNRLAEERNEELSGFRQKNENRDVRMEAEKKYRTQFLRIVIEALTRLQWPPSLEPFSDPLDDLLNNNSLVLSSYLFFLRVGYNRMDIDVSEISPSKSKPRNASVGRRKSSGSLMKAEVPSMSNVSDVSLSSINNASDLNISEIPFEPSVVSSSTDQHIENSTMCDNNSNNVSYLVRTVEILQQQNEALSNELLRLQKSCMARDDANLKLEAVFLDFQKLLGDALHSFSPFSLTSPDKITEEEQIAFENEIKKEATSDDNKQSKLSHKVPVDKVRKADVPPVPIAANANNNNNNSGENKESITKSIEMKRKMHHQIASLNNRFRSLFDIWETSVKECKAAVGSSMRIDPETSAFLFSSSASGTSSSNSMATRGSGSSEFGFESGMMSPSSRTSSRSSSRNKSIGSRQSKDKIIYRTQKPIEINIYRMLGLVPRHYGFGSMNYGNKDHEEGIGFDKTRVFGLQRALIKVAESLSGWADSSGKADLSLLQRSTLIPACHDLVLQLAYLTPLTSWNESSQHSSEISGLDALIQEVLSCDRDNQKSRGNMKKSTSNVQSSSPGKATTTSNNAIAFQQKREKLIDRARAEQQSLARCYQQAMSLVQKWLGVGNSFSRAIKHFQDKWKAMISKVITSVDNAFQSIESVMMIWDKIEKSRVRLDTSMLPSGGNNSNSSWLPLELLSKGLLGDLMSEFVFCLRNNFDSFDSLRNNLKTSLGKVARFGEEEDENMRGLIDNLSLAIEKTAKFPGQNKTSL